MNESDLKRIYDEAVRANDFTTQILIAEIHRLQQRIDSYSKVVDQMIAESTAKERELCRMQHQSYNRAYTPET